MDYNFHLQEMQLMQIKSSLHKYNQLSAAILRVSIFLQPSEAMWLHQYIQQATAAYYESTDTCQAYCQYSHQFQAFLFHIAETWEYPHMRIIPIQQEPPT